MPNRTVGEAIKSPHQGDTWTSHDGLRRIVVVNGMWRGNILYQYKFAGDQEKTLLCVPSKWQHRVQGMIYKGDM